MDEVRIEAGRFIAKVWGTASKRQHIALVCDEGWPFPTDHYIEIEFSRAGGCGR